MIRATSGNGATTIELKQTCTGPVYFGDQGIEVCTVCGGCICCDFAHVDHTRAEYECFADAEGRCHLRSHEGRECTRKEKP